METKHIPENPSSLTLGQWFVRVLGLTWCEVFHRLTFITFSTPRNIIKLMVFVIKAKENGRSLLAIVLTERLGDIIAAQTVLPKLAGPNEDIVWLVRPRFAEILEFNPKVEAVISVSSYTETVILRRCLPKIRWKVLHIDGLLCNMFGLRIINPNAAGVNAKNYYDYGTLADIYSLIGTGAPAQKTPLVYGDQSFDILGFLKKNFEEPENPLLIIHPVSDDAARSWPAISCQTLADWLLDNTRFNIIEFGLTPALQKNNRTHLICRSLTLGQQAALMRKASVFVGVDSSFSHLANAMCVKCIFLIGTFNQFTNHLPWRLKSGDIVLRAPGQVNTLPVNAVTDVLRGIPM